MKWNKLRLLLSGIIFFMAVNLVSAQNMHLVLVGDVGSQTGIGGGVQQDINYVYNEFKNIASALRLNFKSTCITEDHLFNKNSILNALTKQTNIDILIFYYSGHGVCVQKNNHLPYLSVKDGLQTQSVINSIRDKVRPRFSMVITDCCNTKGSAKYAPVARERDAYTTAQIAKLESLFMDYRGEIFCTAARFGQTAYLSDKGSYYTIALLQSMRDALTLSNPSWELILSTAGSQTTKQVAVDKIDEQSPYYDVNLTKINN